MYKYLMIMTLSACCIQDENPKPDSVIDTADTGCQSMWWYEDLDGNGEGCDEPGYGLYSCGQPFPGWVTTGGDIGDCTAGVQW